MCRGRVDFLPLAGRGMGAETLSKILGSIRRINGEKKKMQPLIMAYRADCSYLCTETDWSIANLNVRIAMIGYISQMFEKF